MALSIEDLLLGTEGSLETPERASALAGALKRQRNYGVLGQLMNLEPTKAVGQSLIGQADEGLKLGVGRQEAGLKRTIDAENQRLQREWQQQQYSDTQGIRQQQLDLQRDAGEDRRDAAADRRSMNEQTRVIREAEENRRREAEARDIAAAARARDEARFLARTDAAKDLQQAEQGIELIDTMLNHPSREAATGMSEWRRGIPGSGARGFGSYHDQLLGKAFMQAFETLKGGGQITEKEGEKATAAMTRIQTPYLPEEDYEQALRELREVLDLGHQRATMGVERYTDYPQPGVAPQPGAPQGPPRNFEQEYGIPGAR